MENEYIKHISVEDTKEKLQEVSKTPLKPNECNVCHFQFNTETALREHMQATMKGPQ